MILQNTAKVMQNYTICLPKKIRKQMAIQPKDIVIITCQDQIITLKKAPSSWAHLKGLGKKTYQIYGGGPAYLKKERAGWDKKTHNSN